MRLAWAGYGLFAIAGTATLTLWASFRALDAEPPAPRNALAERLRAVDADDLAWFGTYRLYPGTEGFVIEPGGVLRDTTSCRCDPESPCLYTHFDPVAPGSWERNGSKVRVRSGKGGPVRELELGLLDGAYVLLGEFSAWRRFPDSTATSSSR
jgi:hypothetical protein